jgi:hypothetical protein
MVRNLPIYMKKMAQYGVVGCLTITVFTAFSDIRDKLKKAQI